MGNLDPAAGGDFRREKAEEILLALLENRATIGRAEAWYAGEAGSAGVANGWRWRPACVAKALRSTITPRGGGVGWATLEGTCPCQRLS